MGGRGSTGGGAGDGTWDGISDNTWDGIGNPSLSGDPHDMPQLLWAIITQAILDNMGVISPALLTMIETFIRLTTSKSTTTLHDDYMVVADDFSQLILPGGIKVLYPEGTAHSLAYSIVNIIVAMVKMPPLMRAAVTTIVITAQSYEDAVASSGTADNNIVFYDGGPVVQEVLIHETAHNFAFQKWTDEEGNPPAGSDYWEAVESSEPPINDYARVSWREDFAESVRLYINNPQELKRIAPLRYASIDKLIHDHNYYGF